MTLFTSVDNQQMLWNLINKNDKILSNFNDPTDKYQWFHNIIYNFHINYNEPFNMIQLKQMNKNVIQFMIQDIKHKNRKLAEGGMPVDTYPNIPPEEMAAAEASQLPDEEMEDNYLDFVIDESLSEEEQTYLMNSLTADPQLSVIFDKVVDTPSEFSVRQQN